LKIVLCGDSISVGAGATSQEMLAPYLPPWPVLVTRKLREQYQAPVTLVNRSLGGMIAAWGETNAPMLVQPEAADLCLIGFGMNDRGRPVPVADFMKQIQSIISAARAGNPNVEIILIASWHNNPEWGPSQPLNDYRTAMMALQGPGIAVADLTDISGELLKHKPFVDMSSNNVNHPNDYMVRWYAQAISALLVPQP
jgi:lysophospholipase L1-like esterase